MVWVDPPNQVSL